MSYADPCELCGRPLNLRLFYSGEGGDVVRFADYVPPPPDSIGASPRGLRWFCDEHLEEARRLGGQDSESALRKLRADLGYPETPPVLPELDEPELWVTSVGPNRGRVFGLLRRAQGLSPADARAVMDRAPFRIARGFPIEFASLQEELADAGASVGVKFEP